MGVLSSRAWESDCVGGRLCSSFVHARDSAMFVCWQAAMVALRLFPLVPSPAVLSRRRVPPWATRRLASIYATLFSTA
jgi:hypothetical protein